MWQRREKRYTGENSINGKCSAHSIFMGIFHQQDEFAAVLAALNETHGSGAEKNPKSEDNSDGTEEVAPSSLENKSKKLKKRVQ